jgi:CheY-like chemotaxis protein
MLELMGGKLSVESTPGVGSKFSFNLTFDTIDVAEEIPDQKIVFNELEKPTFEGEILLCEDNTMNQQVICEHLARAGLKTVVAENGKIGVEIVENRIKEGKKLFDLIFMDMHMPVMDGIEASAKIIALNTGIPIVAMTANIMSSDREIYKQSGMNDCVGKPFTSQELWRCLHKYLKPANGITAPQKKTAANDVPIDYDLEFKKALQEMFLKSNPTKIAEITKALQDADIKLAHRLVHTLKGNAGQIGRSALQKIAAEVEGRLKEGENRVTQEQMALLEKELNAALAELADNSAPSGEPEPAQGQTLDAAAALKVLEKLEPLLVRGNPDSLKYTSSLRAVSGSERLIQQIEDFNFESALATFAELKRKFETGE